MTAKSPIGWTYQGRHYTPADPCSFTDPVRCFPFEVAEWKKHALAWVQRAREAAAGDPSRLTVADEIADQIERITEDWCTVFTCHVQVAGLVESARLAHVYATVWAGKPVIPPNTDPWQTEKAKELAKQAAETAVQKVRDWIREKMEEAAQAVKDKVKEQVAGEWWPLVIAAIVAAVVLSSGSRR